MLQSTLSYIILYTLSYIILFALSYVILYLNSWLQMKHEIFKGLYKGICSTIISSFNLFSDFMFSNTLQESIGLNFWFFVFLFNMTFE